MLWVFCLNVNAFVPHVFLVSSEGVWASGTGVSDGFEQPYRCWELHMDPKQEQEVLLTVILLIPVSGFKSAFRICLT